MATPSTNSISDLGTANMELVFFGNELPNGDLLDIFRKLHNHGKGRKYQMLAQFINDATVAVKEEIYKLPTELKKLFPPFESILSWVENTELREGILCGAVDGVLLVVFQIATYIG